MSRIRLLDKSLIDKIAAGEVVERPASVVKEIVENSLDAGSKHIEIEIAGGGMEMIRVSDDGSGMDRDDMILAFARHATSKINTESDLWSLSSMGFRGEALSSIGAVARVTMNTSQGSEGSLIEIAGGEVLRQEAAASPLGTRVTVSDIFFNTPARKKFMKSSVTEGNQIYDIVVRLALSHPNVSFLFKNQKKQIFMTSGNGRLPEVVLAIYGADYARRMMEFDYEYGNIGISGMLGNMELTRKNRKGQLFYVNQRVVKNQILSAALEEAYRGFLLNRERPVGIVFLRIPPEDIDVNVHPQKTEIRFHDERTAFLAVKTAVRETISRKLDSSITGERFFNRADLEQQVEQASLSWKAQEIDYAPKPFQLNRAFPSADDCETPGSTWQGSVSEMKSDFMTRDNPIIGPQDNEGESRLLGQWQNSYLVCELQGRLYIVDQHAAHERLLFNRIKSSPSQINKQELALPVALELSPDLIETAENNRQRLEDFGYVMDRFGEKSMVVRTVPPVSDGEEIETLMEILDSLRNMDSEEIVKGDEPFKVLACKGAVKAGQPLVPQEMLRLLQDWAQTENREFCPHGRPTCMVLDKNQMDKLMKR